MTWGCRMGGEIERESLGRGVRGSGSSERRWLWWEDEALIVVRASNWRLRG